MTERLDSDPRPEPESPPEEPAHGIVEEIREEIEHVVEHVPKPVRWTVRKLVLLVVLSVLGLAALLAVTGILYVSNRTEWVAKELTVFLNGVLVQRSDLALEIDDIRGNPFRDVTLVRPRVRFRTGGAPPLLEAPSIRLRYSAWNLFLSHGRSVEATIEAPQIRLTGRRDGKVRLPLWKSSGVAGMGPTFRVRITLQGGRITAPEPLGGVEGLELDAVVTSGKTTRVEVQKLAWRQGFYATRELRLSGRLESGEDGQFVLRELRSADLDLAARGGWKSGAPGGHVHTDVARVRWSWLAQVTRNRTFDVPGEGQATIDARIGDPTTGKFSSRLTWDDLPVEASGEFSWSRGRLAIQPLTGVSPAGELDGRVTWSPQGWEVGGKARRGDPSHWGAIGIKNWPEGKLNGEFRYTVDTRRPQRRARLDARVEDSELSGWKFDSGEAWVDFPPAGPDSFGVHAFRRGGEGTLLARSTDSGWQGAYTLSRFPLEEWPDGRASGLRGVLGRGEGAVAGVGGRLEVTGTLSGSATDWLGAHMARWRLEGVKGALLPKPDLVATARLEDAMFLGVHFDSAAIAVHLLDREAALDTVTAQAGDTVVTMAAQSAWTDDGWRMSLDRAHARSGGFDWTAEGPVHLAGDKAGVVFERLKARDGPSQLEIAGRWAAPGGSYDWTARAHGLDLSRLGMPPAWQLAGNANAVLEVKGPSGDPRWTLEAQCSRSGWQGRHADSLGLALAGRAGALEVRRGGLWLAGGSLEARGSIARTAHPWPDTLTGDGVTRWLASGAHWDGSVEAREISLERLGDLVPAVRSWSGTLSGKLEIRGSPARPELSASAEARPLGWESYRTDDAKVRVAYRDERLEVSELHLTRGSVVSTAAGAMPLKLALGARPEIPERPMSWRLEAPDGDLAVLPSFVPQVGSASGKFQLNAGIQGTPRHPDLDGFLRIRNGQVRLAGREEVLDGVHADFRLDESRITLDSLAARQGERGRVRARGVVEVSGAGLKGYRFDLTMRDFTAAETGLYVAEFDGDLAVSDGPRVSGQILPMVTGNVELRRAVVLFDFANQTELQRVAATTQPLAWTYRVQVNATNNLHWQPPDGDIEFNANLSLEQTPEQLIIYGEMHALRGTYYFLSNRFAVKQADLTFDNVGGINPVIAAEATTRVQPAREPAAYSLGSGDAAPRPHDITVKIQGRANEPVIEFASDPSDWDEARILRELTVGRFYSGGVALGDPLDNYLTRAINKTLSAEMSRAFRGYIGEWALDRERGGLLSGQGDVIIGVGTQITPNLLLRYRQRVPGLGREVPITDLTASPFERDVEAEYRLNRFFYVTSELTQRRALSGSPSGTVGGPDFNVNLKARWEY